MTVNEVKKDLKKEANDLGFSNENIRDIISKVMDFSKYLEDRKEELTDAAGEYTNKYTKVARSKIKDYPLCSVAGALALGLIIGTLCKRNSDN